MGKPVSSDFPLDRLKRSEQAWIEDFAYVIAQGFDTLGKLGSQKPGALVRSCIYRAAIVSMLDMARHYEARESNDPPELYTLAQKAVQRALEEKHVVTAL